MGNILRKILTEPLVHFAALAACLIAFTPAAPAERLLVIEPAQVASLLESHRLKTGQEPSAGEREALISSLVRDELLRHEAIAMGLHQSDPVVRRRLVQSMEYLAETQAPANQGADAYAEAALRAELEAHPDRYQAPASLDLQHIFAKAGDGAQQRLLEAQRRLQLPEAGAAPESGDPFIKGSKFRAKTQAQLTSLFGAEFAKTVFELAGRQRDVDAGAGSAWLGPIQSSYGWHLVRIQGHSPSRTQTLDSARPALVAALTEARREAQREAFVRKVAERYEIRVDGAVWKYAP